jgi:hypothetical protein
LQMCRGPRRSVVMSMTPIMPDENGQLECCRCGERKPLSGFYRDRMWASGYDRRCKVCKRAGKKPPSPEAKARNRERGRMRWHSDADYRAAAARKARSLDGKRRRMFQCARDRAREQGIPFSITIEDVRIPERCPLLGIALVPGTGKLHAASPSLDRLRPDLGYVPGNVLVVSYRANAIKHDATPEELERIAAALRELLK